jgi:hypothetical protein
MKKPFDIRTVCLVLALEPCRVASERFEKVIALFFGAYHEHASRNTYELHTERVSELFRFGLIGGQKFLSESCYDQCTDAKSQAFRCKYVSTCRALFGVKKNVRTVWYSL